MFHESFKNCASKKEILSLTTREGHLSVVLSDKGKIHFLEFQKRKTIDIIQKGHTKRKKCRGIRFAL